MKPATINQLKKELLQRPPGDLVELVLRLAKYKLENKELLNYLLFEADDEAAYIEKVEAQIHELFEDIPSNQSQYYTRKNLRKILRILNKYIKYSGNKETEATLRLYFCHSMKSYIKISHSTTYTNIYELQIKKVHTVIAKLHEDLQYDFQRELEELE